MSDGNGWPVWSDSKGIVNMDNNHLRNTIAFIERKWDKFPEENDHLVADHWSLPWVVFQPGKPWYKDRLKELYKELNRRNINLKDTTLLEEEK